MKLAPPRKCCSGEAQRMDVVNQGRDPPARQVQGPKREGRVVRMWT